MQCSIRKIINRFTVRLAIAAVAVVLTSPGIVLFAAEPSAPAVPAAVVIAATPIAGDSKEAAVEKVLRKQLDALKHERENLRHEQMERAKQIFSDCRLSPENVKPMMLELERERFKLQTSMTTTPEHIRILTEQVATIAAEAKTRDKSDAVLTILEKTIAARNKVLADLRARMATGAATAVEVSKAEADLSDAEVRLAARREELAKTGGDELERLNRELRNLSINQRLEQVRLRELDDKLKTLQAVLVNVSSCEDVNERISSFAREIERVEQNLLDQSLAKPSR
jgi:hypothetical protein